MIEWISEDWTRMIILVEKKYFALPLRSEDIYNYILHFVILAQYLKY